MEYQARHTYHNQPRGLYKLIARGVLVRASGPHGRERDFTPAQYLAVFGSSGYAWIGVEATGVLTDLGPLFAVAP